ncbi:MAG TPA: hypothetical protein VGN57_12375 [Pirellulaceae bacterium]|jgi:hypothetical protein|nr:hypothetical protein [Pirellulaceae bacterium]
MRVLGAFVVGSLLAVSTLHGQTVRSHSSLRIPTPAIDDSEAASPSAASASAATRSREVPAREASLRRDADSGLRSTAEASRPGLVPLDEAALVNTQDAASARTISATTAFKPISSAPVGTGVQYFGAPAGSSSAMRPSVSPTGYATQANYGAAASPAMTYSQPTVMPSSYPPALSTTSYGVPTSGVAQTSFSQPTYNAPTNVACCGGAGGNPVVTGMQPTFPTTNPPATSYPSASYPVAPYAANSYPTTSYPTTVLSPAMDAAAYAPSLNGSTIPGAACPAPGGGSGVAVPYLINPVAVNIPAVPVDESRLQPVIALRPTVPEESYAGRGILGQPELYVRGQHVRNVLRYITLW